MRDPGSMEIRLSARYLKLTAARPHQVNGAWLTPQSGADRPGPSLELRAAHLIGSSGGAVIACPERVVQKAHAGGHLREFADGCKRRRNPPFNGATAGGEVAMAVGNRVTLVPPPRTGRAAFPHPAPTSDSDGKTLRPSVRAPASVTRFPGSVSGACVAGSRSPRPPPFAPSPPLPVPRFCSATSSLL